MTHLPDSVRTETALVDDDAPPSRIGVALLAGGALALLLAGLLLWWREASRLFTDGLIAAIVACF